MILKSLRAGLLNSVEDPAASTTTTAPATTTAPETTTSAPETTTTASETTTAPDPAARIVELEAALAKEQKETKWRDDRLKAQSGKLGERQQKLEALERELTEAKAGKNVDEAEIERRATEKAKQLTSSDDWTTKMNSMVAEGKKKFGEGFSASLKTIREMVDRNDQGEVTSYNAFLTAAEATGAGPELLEALGRDPGRYQELLATPALKMTIELTKLAGELKKPAPITEAARPITPIGSQGIHYENINPDDPERAEQLPIGVWMERREKQARDRGLQ